MKQISIIIIWYYLENDLEIDNYITKQIFYKLK